MQSLKTWGGKWGGKKSESPFRVASRELNRLALAHSLA